MKGEADIRVHGREGVHELENLRLVREQALAGVAGIMYDHVQRERSLLLPKDIVSSAAAMLALSHPQRTGGVYLGDTIHRNVSSDRLKDVLSVYDIPPFLPDEQRKSVSEATIAKLEQHGLKLLAPVDSGSKGADMYDKTQRGRRMFEPSPTAKGSSRDETYYNQLFAGAVNSEIRERVIDSLRDKTIFNLGGGNASLTQQLRQEGANGVEVINVEPYPSEVVLNPDENVQYDTIAKSDPASPDFFEQSGLDKQSADEVWAVYSVPAYLGTSQEVNTLFSNISQMLKPGGVARISHLGIVNRREGDGRKEAIIESLTRLKEVGWLVESVDTAGSYTTLILTAPQ